MVQLRLNWQLSERRRCGQSMPLFRGKNVIGSGNKVQTELRLSYDEQQAPRRVQSSGDSIPWIRGDCRKDLQTLQGCPS